MKKTTRKVIKRVSTIEVPGFPLPMILVHGMEAQTMLGEQMIQGVAPLDGEGKAHRLLAFTVTQRFERSRGRSAPRPPSWRRGRSWRPGSKSREERPRRAPSPRWPSPPGPPAAPLSFPGPGPPRSPRRRRRGAAPSPITCTA